MNLIDVFERFPDQESCIEHLERVKWRSFQSRNRESYLFKCIQSYRVYKEIKSFNLVIENLIFSSLSSASRRLSYHVFQSRNRESYLFKFEYRLSNLADFFSFNLVIENLIFSRRGVVFCWGSDAFRFNLVIENLIFSSPAIIATPASRLKVSIS